MNKGDSLLIEKVANGYVLRPWSQHSVTSHADVFVFQRLGSPLCEGDDKSVMDFLDGHFNGMEKS